MNSCILLVDFLVPDTEYIKECTLDSIGIIDFPEKTIRLEDCLKKILGIDNLNDETFGISNIHTIGLIKCNDGNFFNLPITENLDNDLLKDVKNFFNTLKVYGLQNFDLISCNSFNDNWKNFINIIETECGINFRASVNITGYSGDWILESHNIDLVGLYFKESIKDYKHSLDFSSHMMFIDKNNKLFGWGNGAHNRIGKYPTFGSNFRLDRFYKLIMKGITGYSTATKQIAHHVNAGSIFVLLDDQSSNSLYSLGPNWVTGRGANSDFRVRMAPTPVPNGKIPDQIVTGGYGFSFIKMTDGTVYATGSNNEFGILGLGHQSQVGVWTQVSLPNGLTAKKIAVTFFSVHILMNDQNGSIYSCGRNTHGMFGNGTLNTSSSTLTRMTTVPSGKIPVDIICGSDHVVVLMSDGTIFTCGLNGNGQLGYQQNTGYGVSHTLTQIRIPIELRELNIKPKKISCGSNHTLVLMDDEYGTLLSFGYNNAGQCGQGGPHINDIFVPTIVPNSTGKIPIKISCGSSASYVLMSDGTLCAMGSYGVNWNSNETGPKYFLGQVLSEKIPKFDTIFDIYSSPGMAGLFLIFNDTRKSIYLSATTANGEVIRRYGVEMEEGYNPVPTDNIYYPSNSIPKTVTMGSTVSYVIDTRGILYTIGYSDVGQLGMGNIAPSSVSQNGDLTQINGWQFAPNWQSPLTIPSGKKVLQVTCGANATHILLDDYTIYGCGNNFFGILGNGINGVNINKSFTPMNLSMFPAGSKPKKIVSGTTTFYVLLNNTAGSIYACGENNNWGSFGIDNGATLYNTLTSVPIPAGKVPVDMAAGMQWFAVLMSDGTLYSSGNSTRNATGNGGSYNNWSKTLIPMIMTNVPSGLKPKKLASSDHNLFILMDDASGSIYCCGDDRDYQCGVKNSNNSTVPILTKMDNFPDNFKLIPVDIYAINRTTFIKMSNGELWACGNNANGQCGIGIDDDYNYAQQPNYRNQIVRQLTRCVVENVPYFKSVENYSFDEIKSETGFSFMKVISEGEYTKQELTTEGLTLQRLVSYPDTNISYIKKLYTYQDFMSIGYSTTRWLTDMAPPLSPICFISGTPVVTDQGTINIENIDPSVHTINKRTIKAVTCSKTPETNLVCVKKNAFSKNVPCEDTIMSKNHKIYYNNTMIPIKNFVNYGNYVDKISYVNYNGENLYNILFDKHGLMLINNLIVESLDPKNIVAQLYSNDYTIDEIDKITRKMNYLLETEQNDKYLEFCSNIKR